MDHTERPRDPEPEFPPCATGGVCFSDFAVVLAASEPWALGRYFLRVAVDRAPATVCEIAFGPVVGAVTDTCNGPDRNFRVTYRYDEEGRAIEQVSFPYTLSRVDLEILITEELPPLVEVHHDVVVRKCSYFCAVAEPLSVPVQPSSVTAPSSDAGAADAREGAPDATADGSTLSP